MVTSAFAAGAYAAQSGAAPGILRAASAQPANAGFGEMVQSALRGAVESGQKAEAQASQAVQGKGNLVDVVTAVAESEAAVETLVAVRDRVIAAYEDIMRMPI